MFTILTFEWSLSLEWGPGVSPVFNDIRDDAASNDLAQFELVTGGDTKSKSSSSDINVTRLPPALSKEGKPNSLGVFIGVLVDSIFRVVVLLLFGKAAVVTFLLFDESAALFCLEEVFFVVCLREDRC